MRPSFENVSDLSIFSGIYDFSINVPVSENWNLTASFPYLTASTGDSEGDEGTGNVFVGIQHLHKSDDKKSAVTSFGIYLPTADRETMIFGLLTHFEEYKKYTSDVITLYGNFAYFNIGAPGARFGLEIGPDILIPRENSSSGTEFLIHYGLTAGFHGDRFALITELVGLAIITQDVTDFSDRFEHSINFGASYLGKNFSPGVFYKIYLKEDMRDLVNGVLGINLEVTL